MAPRTPGHGGQNAGEAQCDNGTLGLAAQGHPQCLLLRQPSPSSCKPSQLWALLWKVYSTGPGVSAGAHAAGAQSGQAVEAWLSPSRSPQNPQTAPTRVVPMGATGQAAAELQILQLAVPARDSHECV